MMFTEIDGRGAQRGVRIGWCDYRELTELPAPQVRDAAVDFYRGNASVVDFTYGFRRAVAEVLQRRPLDGVEIDLSELLERWEQSGSAGRPAVVNDLRAVIRSIADD